MVILWGMILLCRFSGHHIVSGIGDPQQSFSFNIFYFWEIEIFIFIFIFTFSFISRLQGFSVSEFFPQEVQSWCYGFSFKTDEILADLIRK